LAVLPQLPNCRQSWQLSYRSVREFFFSLTLSRLCDLRTCWTFARICNRIFNFRVLSFSSVFSVKKEPILTLLSCFPKHNVSTLFLFFKFLLSTDRFENSLLFKSSVLLLCHVWLRTISKRFLTVSSPSP
jgi:hypothetical protein